MSLSNLFFGNHGNVGRHQRQERRYTQSRILSIALHNYTMSFNWTASSVKRESSRETSDDTEVDEQNGTTVGEKERLHSAMKLCTESSGLMATVSTLRSTVSSKPACDKPYMLHRCSCH